MNKNPIVRYEPPARRAYHRDRNYAVIMGLIDSVCRIGEVLSFKLDDYDKAARQITVRESKGRESQVIPKDLDEGWLFPSEFATCADEERFLKSLKKYAEYAGASDAITLHSLR